MEQVLRNAAIHYVFSFGVILRIFNRAVYTKRDKSGGDPKTASCTQEGNGVLVVPVTRFSSTWEATEGMQVLPRAESQPRNSTNQGTFS